RIFHSAMKTKTIGTVPLIVIAFLLAACGSGNRTEAQLAPTEPVKPETARLPIVRDGRITITGNDRMQFNLTEFTVKAGSEVELVFRNVGELPKNAMGHNLLILVKDGDRIAFAEASARHSQ